MSQHLPEDLLGFIRSTGSVLGLCGIASYKLLERRFHARKMSIIGLILQNMCLWACVVSIFLPGSPFDLNGYISSINFENWMSQSKLKSTMISNTNQTSVLNMTSFLSKKTVNEINWSDWTINGNPAMSIFAFFGGVTAARLGLVMVDLSTLQIMQESILEDERGTVFGVQSALCQLFSVMRDMLCIILPDPRSFGILIILSMVFVSSGLLNYSFYMFRTRKEDNQGPQPRVKTVSGEEIIDSLETHLAVDHFNSDPFQCERCCTSGRPSKFPTESAVKRHYIEDHRLEKFFFRTWVTREIEANRIAIRKCLDKCIQAALGHRNHAKPPNSPFCQAPNSHFSNRDQHSGAPQVACTNNSLPKDPSVRPTTNQADVITIGEDDCLAAVAKKKKCLQVDSDLNSQSDSSEPSSQEVNPSESVQAQPSSDQFKPAASEEITAVKEETVSTGHKTTPDCTSRTTPFVRCTARNPQALIPGYPRAGAMASMQLAAMHHQQAQYHSRLSRTATLATILCLQQRPL
uniref:Solute carrier family 40 member n=1 Tax=Ditylenchus dipsaci TaxID=166011 RepID=A0A915EG74_9BILA